MEISIEGERSKKIFEDFRLPQMWLIVIDSGCGVVDKASRAFIEVTW